MVRENNSIDNQQKKLSLNEKKNISSLCNTSNIQSILKKIANQKRTPINSKMISVYNKLQTYSKGQKSFNQVSQRNNKILFSKKKSADEKKNKYYLKNVLQSINQHNKTDINLDELKHPKTYVKSKRKYNSVHTSNINHSPGQKSHKNSYQTPMLDSLHEKKLKVTT